MIDVVPIVFAFSLLLCALCLMGHLFIEWVDHEKRWERFDYRIIAARTEARLGLVRIHAKRILDDMEAECSKDSQYIDSRRYIGVLKILVETCDMEDDSVESEE